MFDLYIFFLIHNEIVACDLFTPLIPGMYLFVLSEQLKDVSAPLRLSLYTAGFVKAQHSVCEVMIFQIYFTQVRSVRSE